MQWIQVERRRDAGADSDGSEADDSDDELDDYENRVNVACWTDLVDLLRAGPGLKSIKLGHTYFRSRGEHSNDNTKLTPAQEKAKVNSDPKIKEVLEILRTNYKLLTLELRTYLGFVLVK